MSKLDEFIDKIETGITELATLRIETLMGNLEKTAEGIDLKADPEIQGVVSEINLLSGDIKTKITEDFYKNYPELVQFHQSRELKGHEILQGNFEALKSIYEIIKGFNKK